MTRRALRCLLSGMLLLVATACAFPTGALASHQQQAMFLDTAGILGDPVTRLDQLRELGVERVRLFVAWDYYAPAPLSYRRPRFRESDPAAYPAGAWSRLDAAVLQARADRIAINLDVGGGSPLWATAKDHPRDRRHPNWSPNAGDYKAFVRAIATRYSGNYDPLTNRISPGN